MDSKENYVKEIADLATEASRGSVEFVSEPTIRDQPIPVLVRPTGSGSVAVESVKALLDQWRTAPERRAGTAKMSTLESMTNFVTRHKDADSALFASLDEKAPSITAVFDYHRTDGAPQFGKHRAVYAFPLSIEWQAWKGADGRSMTQSEWASFIEERIAELAAPLDAECSEYERLFQTKIALPSDLIGLSRGMQVSVEAKIRDFRTLQSGETEIVYEEVHKDGTGQKLIVPGLFVVRIPLFVDSEPTRLIARLRYRRKDGLLSWFYQLYRADLVMRECMRNDAESVARESGLPLFEGAPEA